MGRTCKDSIENSRGQGESSEQVFQVHCCVKSISHSFFTFTHLQAAGVSLSYRKRHSQCIRNHLEAWNLQVGCEFFTGHAVHQGAAKKVQPAFLYQIIASHTL